MGLIIPIERIREKKEGKKTAEYIERDKLVDALGELCDRICQYSKRQRKVMCGACPLGDAFAVIEGDIPAADVRPVVLCRDCKNNYNTCLNHGINEPMCDFTDRKLREDDFCSRGEKREES